MSLIIYYGPYESNGLIRHKPERLRGILRKLSNLGYHIEIVPTRHLERLTIEMRDREIYRCNIKYLKYNMDYEDDEMAQRVVSAVQESHARFYGESNIPRYLVNKWGMRGIQAQRKKLDPQEIFSSKIDLIYEIPKKT